MKTKRFMTTKRTMASRHVAVLVLAVVAALAATGEPTSASATDDRTATAATLQPSARLVVCPTSTKATRPAARVTSLRHSYPPPSPERPAISLTLARW